MSDPEISSSERHEDGVTPEMPLENRFPQIQINGDNRADYKANDIRTICLPVEAAMGIACILSFIVVIAQVAISSSLGFP
ncbi:uncharacterized protein L201_006221 [Kwoniella dendrophila CBS 6074]|uniref:Uncharacterized protein n=1 Tax=Kwoniella dendrophila CBS 6074 TaxID=1295534 RepID=A0AAX4K2F1_9TREE